MKTLFWVSLFLVFYTFAGYGIVLFLLVKIRRILFGKRPVPVMGEANFPTLTLVVAAYNEAGIIEAKIRNSLALNYPSFLLRILFITDGSDDETPEIVARYPALQLMHSDERRGKIHAIHRAMETVNSEIVVFTDANTFLNPDALLLIARHYENSDVGAVSGEKRVRIEEVSDATAGEGIYWKYESTLKRWDSELYSVVGAAGELFSVRRSLYENVPADTILDDFMISMEISAKGYRVVYEPDAYATELSSENIEEELKRKVRIAAGGIQSIVRLKKLLNPLPHPLLTFQYISHRVLRWTITPFLLILILLANVLIVLDGNEALYKLLLAGQLAFYGLATLGWVLESRKIRVKALFIPFYFCLMNYAVFAGIIRYFSGRQGAAWAKSRRKNE